MKVHRGAVRRVSAGVMATGGSFVITTAATLLLVPLYLRAWSTATYGEWMALSAMAYYLQNFDFGLTAATLNAATMAHARGDRQEFEKVRDTAWAIAVGVFVVALIGVSVLAFTLPIGDWLHFKMLSARDVQWMTVLLGAGFLLTVPIVQLRNAFAATGRFHVYQWLWNIAAVQTAVITAVQLVARQSPLKVAVGGFVSQCVALLTAVVALWLQDRALLPRFSGVGWKTTRALLAPSASFGIGMLSTSIQLQIPVLLISRNLGGTAVAMFTSARTLCNLLKQVPLLVQLPLSRELSALAGQRRKHELTAVHRAFVTATLLIGVAILAFLFSEGTWVIRLWTHGRLNVDSTMLRVLALAIFVDANLFAWTATVLAKNENRGVAQIQLLASLLMSVTTMALLPRLQSLAAPLAMLGVSLVFAVPLLLTEVVRRDALRWPWAIKNMLAPLALSVAVVSVVCLVAMNSRMSSPVVVGLAAGAGSFAVVAFGFFGLLMTESERMTVRGVVRRVLPV